MKTTKIVLANLIVAATLTAQTSDTATVEQLKIRTMIQEIKQADEATRYEKVNAFKLELKTMNAQNREEALKSLHVAVNDEPAQTQTRTQTRTQERSQEDATQTKTQTRTQTRTHEGTGEGEQLHLRIQNRQQVQTQQMQMQQQKQVQHMGAGNYQNTPASPSRK